MMSTMMLLAFAGSGPVSAADAAKGKQVYMANCMACHGAKADGKGPAAGAMSPKPTDFSKAAYWSGKSDDDVEARIKAGVPGTGMMAFTRLSDSDLANVVAFLRTQAPTP